jgi:hypothetical protein
MDKSAEGPKEDHFVEVRVVTTSGSYPTAGFDRVNANQKVRQQLDKAAAHLGITNTDGWDAKVGDSLIDPNKSYTDNGLAGQVVINFHKHEGGGGCE